MATTNLPDPRPRLLACCGGLNGDPAEHFHGCAAKGHPIPGTCSCGTRLGCAVHGPQPRERTIPCRWCKCPTWNWDAVCGHCSHPYTGVCCMDEWPEGPGAA